MKWLIVPLIICFNTAAFAIDNYNFNNRCRAAYKAIYELKIAEADQIIAVQKEREPSNLIIAYLEGSSLFISTLLSNNNDIFERNKLLIESKINRLKSCSTNNQYYYFCRAELYFQLSLLSANFGNTFESIKYGRSANNQYDKCLKNYPSFVPAKMGQGYINVLLGQVPDSYKWAIELIGLSANSANGIKQLDDAYSYSSLKDTLWKKQNTLLISSLYKVYEQQGYSESKYYDKYIAWLEGATDPLSTFILSTRLNKMGKTDQAIALINHCNRKAPYQDIPALDLLLGTMKLQRLDKDAINALSRFALKCKSRMIGYKDITQRMAWYYLINGDYAKYNKLISTIKGEHITNVTLLKARLLFDGGYITRSKDTLQTLNHTPLTKAEQSEYYYRMGRINEQQNRHDLAITNYSLAINTKSSTRYPASAALKLGNIYNKKGDIQRAKETYNQALKMKFTEYYDEIINDIKQELNSINK